MLVDIEEFSYWTLPFGNLRSLFSIDTETIRVKKLFFRVALFYFSQISQLNASLIHLECSRLFKLNTFQSTERSRLEAISLQYVGSPREASVQPALRFLCSPDLNHFFSRSAQIWCRPGQCNIWPWKICTTSIQIWKKLEENWPDLGVTWSGAWVFWGLPGWELMESGGYLVRNWLKLKVSNVFVTAINMYFSWN